MRALFSRLFAFNVVQNVGHQNIVSGFIKSMWVGHQSKRSGSKRGSTVLQGKTQAELLSSNVAGFIYVTEVDMANKRFTYLAPGPGELPSRNLLTGSLKWIET